MKIHVFIDASNLWAAQKVKGYFFDYEKLKKYVKDKFKTTSVEISYYTAYPADRTREYSLEGRHRFYTFLKKGLGINVVKKKLKRIRTVTEEGETIEEKGNMDVEITIDALHNMKKYDTAILFTGDSDFLALASYLMGRGKQVYIFSSRNNVSEELRTGSNGYTDVLDIETDIWGKEIEYRKKRLKGEINH
ncbi:hypothetical protein A3A64_02645 [Candidatus Gottesmanbacteria bacterium RIFCSPLOWO2_01_FULL_48_11]|uniref:NYN domain-containing protein n=3 Tax=Patescibacteria group TaxID=1783273 RepID=A0A1F6ATN0_9BACT|nr:MAG: hypothetical protein UX29_C0004G0032 [Parcubacteria group bacterium GW2011_GWA2_46_10]KKU22110.1 MAG: hypothetical protein UX31_C0006G0022 [Candidatus Nomurabacteria bacterium GW2011_GWA1_46_11]OGG28039.1 MAG: hypothetical protein A3A64_02645 [Candidatus Gottesmanbacteria bacterium RIFCSPLOWO2_01_FULL_48_11]OGY56372.1 MAG: hypothetical protein A2119_02515 [Candidatus Colwellbacteria bacterium GWA2_46_10]